MWLCVQLISYGNNISEISNHITKLLAPPQDADMNQNCPNHLTSIIPAAQPRPSQYPSVSKSLPTPPTPPPPRMTLIHPEPVQMSVSAVIAVSRNIPTPLGPARKIEALYHQNGKLLTSERTILCHPSTTQNSRVPKAILWRRCGLLL